jgi:hypothetical protein
VQHKQLAGTAALGNPDMLVVLAYVGLHLVWFDGVFTSGLTSAYMTRVLLVGELGKKVENSDCFVPYFPSSNALCIYAHLCNLRVGTKGKGWEGGAVRGTVCA